MPSSERSAGEVSGPPPCGEDLEHGLPSVTRADGVEIVIARDAGYCYGVERALGITAASARSVEDALACPPPTNVHSAW